MSKTTMTMAFAVITAGGMAMASAQSTTTTTPPPAPRVEMTANHLLPGQLRVTEMTGAAVYDNQGQNIGSIKDIILDSEGRVTAVVLNVSGTLGMGGRYVAVGINDLTIANTNAKPRFTIDMLKAQLSTAQTYDLNEAKRVGTSTPPPPLPDNRTPPSDSDR
jgi:sporulation protein YlmC with PRC-barrel domain